MDIFVAIQHTYDGIDFALFHGQTILEQHALSKFHASAQLIPMLDQMLKNNQIALSDLAFIAAHQGPGPFTTLRVVIATINGIAFASNMPLIGVNGLEAFLREYQDPSCDRTICMLNAFNHDVYYAYHDAAGKFIMGSAPAESFLKEIASTFSDVKRIQFLGNAIAPYRSLIDKLFGNRAVIPVAIPEHCSIQQIGLMGYAQWQRQENVTRQLIPHYLKTQQFTKIH